MHSLTHDNDGWDANRDGGITPDVSRTLTALALGESLSTLEEYFVHNDDGNSVLPGLKSVRLGDQTDTHMHIPLSFTASPDEMSLIHHDVRDLDSSSNILYTTTKYGLSVFDYTQMSSYDHWMPRS